MNELKLIYTYIGELRAQGIKMKDIANHINLPSSVLSALYATVLPVYLDNIEKTSHEEALEKASSLVNNVSKKRLLGSLNEIKSGLESLINMDRTKLPSGFFGDTLKYFSIESTDISFNYLGRYTSYSLSSSTDALKKEPFILSKSENGEIKVARKSVYNSINKGAAIITNGHSMYILLNEIDDKQLGLVSIYLQLPFYEYPKFLRGIYLTLDYNRNPIARRIIFIKESDNFDMDDLEQASSEIIKKENFTEEQQAYYNYSHQNSDQIRMCSIPNPKFDEEDLSAEKKLLSLMYNSVQKSEL